jgi:SAM-dependent methyltransferase
MPTDAIHWETIPCPLCGTADDREFLRTTGDDGRAYRLGQCTVCEMVYTNPRPDAASIGAFYPQDYSPYQPAIAKEAKPSRSLSDRIPVRPGGTLLDYGCGSGKFAARMRNRGWNAVGMDFSEYAVEAARRNFNLKAIRGMLPHPMVPTESLDAFTMRAVLEHVHDPRSLLSSAFDALRPGGSLYISVPNIASWGYRTFGPAWYCLDVPRHLLHFSATTLRKAVEDRGFVVSAIETGGHTKWMGNSARRATRVSPSILSRLCTIRLLRSAVTRWTQWTDQADDLTLLAVKPEKARRRAAA